MPDAPGRLYDNMNEEKCFGLGPGRLYIAPVSIPEEELFTMPWYAGPTKDGVTLSYCAKVHEITDYFGTLVRSVRYGERIRLEGKLSRIYPGAICRAVGAPFYGGEIPLGALSDAGRCAQVRVGILCTLPEGAGGGDMRFVMRASASSGAILALSAQRDSSVAFSLTAETDGAGMTGRLVFQ